MDDQALFSRRKVEDEGSLGGKKFFNEELSQLHTVLLGLVSRYTLQLSVGFTAKQQLTVLLPECTCC